MVSVANRRSIMLLYSDRVSPLGHCVRIVLAEKGVNVEIHYVEDGERPEELNDLNPYNTILTLVDRELVLYEATIIMEYLDERFPHPPLLPVDPIRRAENRQFRYRVMRDLYVVLEALEGDNEIAAENAKKILRDHLTVIAPIFAEKPFFMSNDFTLIDCCMAPLLWRLLHYGIKLPSAAKLLLTYGDRLFEREAFQNSLSAIEKVYR